MNPVQLIKQDHRTVKGLFRRFRSADRHAEKQKIGQEIIEELSVHAAIEEQLIYPVLRARGERAEEAVLNALEEHHAVKLVLKELDELSADHERYEAKMHVVCESVEGHIEEEESKLLPRLEALDPDDRRMLAESMAKMKQSASRHPHPEAADTPPTGLIAGLIARLSDSSKDVVRTLTNADKAAGHRRVTRRARAKTRPRRSTNRKTRRSTRTKVRRTTRAKAQRSKRSASSARGSRRR